MIAAGKGRNNSRLYSWGYDFGAGGPQAEQSVWRRSPVRPAHRGVWVDVNRGLAQESGIRPLAVPSQFCDPRLPGVRVSEYAGADRDEPSCHPSDVPRLDVKFDLMAAMHVKWVRMVIDWSVVEADRGKLNWIFVDEIVDEAAARGISLLALLAFSPVWASSQTTSESSTASHARPKNMSDYANFARSAAERYASRGVHSWEIWNEPNIGQFWPPHPDADEYGGIFRVAAEAIRGVDPTATILVGGLAQQPDAPSVGITPAAFLEQLYRNGAAQLADGVAAHPYSFPSMPLDSSGQSPGGFIDLPKLHEVMDRHGDGGKKIWLTDSVHRPGPLLTPYQRRGRRQYFCRPVSRSTAGTGPDRSSTTNWLTMGRASTTRKRTSASSAQTSVPSRLPLR